jgi:hypothetical protein
MLTKLFYKEDSGGSRKSVTGWQFVEGGDDRGQKTVFEAYSR